MSMWSESRWCPGGAVVTGGVSSSSPLAVVACWPVSRRAGGDSKGTSRTGGVWLCAGRLPAGALTSVPGPRPSRPGLSAVGESFPLCAHASVTQV